MVADPFSLSMLAYPAGLAVSNVIGKVIDITLYQPQVSQSRQNELYTQHQFRLEELKRQHEQSIISSLINSDIRINEQEIIEQLRASYAVWTNAAIRNVVKEEENSPFFDGIETTHKNLKTLYEQTHQPIVLVCPFWDDSKNKVVGEQGGYVDFRTAFNTSYRQASWQYLASKQDGYFKRPLSQTDRDINYIYSVLSDVPVILIHGTIQGGHSPHQQVQRIHPQITFWNLFPDENLNSSQFGFLDLKFFSLQLPIGQGNSPDIYQQIGKYSLSLQDAVGKYLTKATGLLSSFYHLYHFETRPNLQQFQLENEKELEILSLQANRFYDFLAHKSPNKVDYYTLEKSILLLERELYKVKEKKELTLDSNSDDILSETEICSCFAAYLEKMAESITEFEQQKQSNNTLISTDYINDIELQKQQLLSKKFRFLVIGDFNRGKSTILNVLLGQSALPTGVTPTTAIPTFVKYGLTEKVIVYKKSGTKEYLTPDEYQQKYTLYSKEVRNKIGSKRLFKSIAEWLDPIDYAEFYAPIEMLSRSVEFIDTAGLNNTEEQNQKTFSYIEQCHAILFVLAADREFTQQEEDYLKRLIGIKQTIENNEHQKEITSRGRANTKQVRPIFYLINKWEHIPDEEKQEIHDYFVDSFCKCLKTQNGEFENLNDEEIEKIWDEVEQMWGNIVFDVYARTALENIEQGKSLESTGFMELHERLNQFLTEEKLITKLAQVVQTAEIVKNKIASQVNDKLTIPKNINNEIEAKLLQSLTDNLSIQVEIIKAHYNNIISSYS